MMYDIHTLKKIVSLIDLTRLSLQDTEQDIIHVCQKANASLGKVASVCVFPQFIALAKQQLSDENIAITTVVNFPTGQATLNSVCREISDAIAAGADEIDVVTPYHVYLGEPGNNPLEFLTQCRRLCHNKVMKVILETGALANEILIQQASIDAITAGADFLKTSTGKIAIGATIPAAQIMLHTINDMNANVGLKLSGGIQTIEQAYAYLTLVEKTMGLDWVTPQHLRFGASQLLDRLYEAL